MERYRLRLQFAGFLALMTFIAAPIFSGPKIPSARWPRYPYTDEFRSEWYSKHLKQMNEPDFWSLPSNGIENYRFIWLRTWGNPVALTLWRDSEAAWINTKVLDGDGGYAPGKLIQDSSTLIPLREWEKFEDNLEKTDFWNMTNAVERAGMDGAQWIFESNVAGRRHLVDRWSPDTGSYRAMCVHLIGIANFSDTETGRNIY